MISDVMITTYCRIKNNTVTVNGETVFSKEEDSSFSEFAKTFYKAYEMAYSKFFKMDNLSKLAFLAAEILFAQDSISEDHKSQMGIVLSNNSSSLDTDRKHQDSIANPEEHYPSPALFVYTLPNICIGEISIKHRIQGEHAFFVSEQINTDLLVSYTQSLVQNKKSANVLCGWVDFDGQNYDAFMYLVSPNGTQKHTKEIINHLYHNE